jgi:hypothetical protein
VYNCTEIRIKIRTEIIVWFAVQRIKLKLKVQLSENPDRSKLTLGKMAKGKVSSPLAIKLEIFRRLLLSLVTVNSELPGSYYVIWPNTCRALVLVGQ